MKKKLLVVFVVLFVLLSGFYIIIPPISVKTKVHTVHISIDDVSKCFDEITQDSCIYSTLADYPFFAELDRLHVKYGASFSLYLYYRDGNYNVEKITKRYKTDFKHRCDWLKLGFHAVQPGFDTLRDGSIDTLRLFMDKVNKAISCFADSTSITYRLRLNRFYATQPQIAMLDSIGITGLMGADDDRLSYSLPKSLNTKLRKHGKIMYGNVEILRTDIRLENIFIPEVVLREHGLQDTLTIFTHEREFGFRNRWKLERLLELLSRNHPVYFNR